MIPFDFRILYAVGLFGDFRGVTAVEVTPCHSCALCAGGARHAVAVALRDVSDTMEFFDAYTLGACIRTLGACIRLAV